MQVLWNDDEGDHAEVVRGLFKGANHFDCAVAFATENGLQEFRGALRDRLSKGMSARFIVSLDFFQTHPALLQELLRMSSAYNVKAFVYHPSPGEVFHPKIYRFEYDDGVTLIVGSANWTKGGLSNNYECSALLRLSRERDVKSRLDELVRHGIVAPLTHTIVIEYKRRHAIAHAIRAAAEKRIARLSKSERGGEEALALVLGELRADKSEMGFAALVKRRTKRRAEAVAAISAIISTAPRDAKHLRPLLSSLQRAFDSGGLQRHVTTIALAFEDLIPLLKVAKEVSRRSPKAAYAAMQRFDIPRLGPNWITEILQALNPSAYAVLNRNSVSGLALAGFVFPERPTKANTNPQRYAEFCAAADGLVGRLGLSNLAELDVLLNHVYWHPDIVEDDEE